MKNILKILSGCLVAFALFAPDARADGTNLTAAQAWVGADEFFTAAAADGMADESADTRSSWRNSMTEQAAQAGALADRALDFYTQISR